MHPREIALDDELVRALLTRQFPAWANLPIEFVATGTVNAMYRLGDDMVIRLPFVEWGSEGIEREATWLPRLAPRLDSPIPIVLGVGEPDADYPCPWLVLSWLPGAFPVPGRIRSPDTLAVDLADFVSALRRIDTTPTPRSDTAAAGSPRNLFRDALRVDDATWSRGRGWALSQAAIALPYYRDSNPFMARTSTHILRELERS